jgi:hypothetical protein
MFYKRIFPIIIVLSCFAGCKQPKHVNEETLKSITARVDKLELFYYRDTDTLKVFVTDKERIDLICGLLDGKVDESLKECRPDGHILFFSKDEIVFEAKFTIDDNCAQLSYFLSPQHYSTKLTYKAGMFLSEATKNSK